MEKEKNLVVVLDGTKNTRDYYKMLLPLFGYEVICCEDKEQFDTALKRFGRRVRCLVMDETIPGSGLCGSTIAWLLQDGKYGDEPEKFSKLKGIPVVIRDGDFKQSYTPTDSSVYCIDKSPGSMHALLSFIKNLSPPVALDPQAARNERNKNVELLVRILGTNKRGVMYLIPACESVGIKVTSIKQGLAYLRYISSNAFAGGVPDNRHLQALKKASDVTGIHMERDGEMEHQFDHWLREIKTTVRKELGRVR